MIKKIILFICLYPSLLFAQDIKIEGRVFIDSGPLEGAQVYVYTSYKDINANTPFLTSEPSNKQGLYKIQLPPGKYYFTAQGQKDGSDFFSYHGANPVQIEREKIWLTLMANRVKPPVYSDGETSLRGIITYKGAPVKDAYISVYSSEAGYFKGLGIRTESVNEDGTFGLSLPIGRYVVVAKKMKEGKRIRPLKKGDLYCYYALNPVKVRPGMTVSIEVPCYPKADRHSFAEAPQIKPRDFKSVRNLSGVSEFGISGTVRDLEGNPSAGLFVLAYKSRSPVFLMYHLSHGTEYIAETDRNGSYFIPLDSGGIFHVVARNRLGGIPQRGDIFGIYEGSPEYIVPFKAEQSTENIDIVVGNVMSEESGQGAETPREENNTVYRSDHMMDEDTVWSGNITINGRLSVKRGVTLTIKPGTVVKFNKIDRDRNGIGDGEIMVEGRIIARGSRERRIIFTSAEKEPAPKDWSYVILMATGMDNIFEYCEFRYGFTGLQAFFSNAKVTDSLFSKNDEGIRFTRTNLVLVNNSFLSNGIGIRHTVFQGVVVIKNNQISNNKIGVLMRRSHINKVDFDRIPAVAEHPEFRNNNIYNNHRYNFRIGERLANDINVKNNWWGSEKSEFIEEKIFDKKQDIELGRAVFFPYLAEPVQDAGVRNRPVPDARRQ